MDFYAGKLIKSTVYCLYKQLSAGYNLCYVISLYYNSVKWIKRWKIHISMVAFKNFFSKCTFLPQGKKDTTYLVEKFYVTSIIRTRIECDEIKYSCQKLAYCCNILKTKNLSNCFNYPFRAFKF